MGKSAKIVLFRNPDLHRLHPHYHRVFVGTTQEEVDEAVEDMKREGYIQEREDRVQILGSGSDFDDYPIGRIWKPGSVIGDIGGRVGSVFQLRSGRFSLF